MVTREQNGKPDVAPEGLEVLRLFMNTRDLEAEFDELDEATHLATWLQSHELLRAGETVDQADVAKAVRLREAIRAVLRDRSDPSRASAAAAAFNMAAQSAAPLQVEISPDLVIKLVSTRSGVPRALARIVAAVAEHAGTPCWERLKVCSNPDCQWAFYDHARNKTGRWCNMATCGNKSKAKSYRRRQVEAATASIPKTP
ncbi:CGNR zinc finger domain-containing protein [Sphaerisporangium perillae]|uniref:CGNR zinc finger domain-containing protein n=1 Tax=Sphaerisporangium perillae TaxID=2935860 RepID=UPI00200E633D|nr:CGNR zinc finger domain-containing protein [Sphaerisporangium perillae]